MFKLNIALYQRCLNSKTSRKYATNTLQELVIWLTRMVAETTYRWLFHICGLFVLFSRVHLTFCSWVIWQWGYCHLLHVTHILPLDQICKNWFFVLVNIVLLGILLYGKFSCTSFEFALGYKVFNPLMARAHLCDEYNHQAWARVEYRGEPLPLNWLLYLAVYKLIF